MKVIEENKTQELLIPKQEYLKNAGVNSVIMYDKVNLKNKGPYKLLVEDEDYVDAIQALDEIDTYAFADVNDEDGKVKNVYAKMAALDALGVWAARLFIIAVAAAIVYMIVK